MSQSSRDNNGIRSCFSGGNLDEEWDIATISRDHPTGKNVLHVLHEISFFAQMNQIRRSLQSPSLFNSKNCLQSRSTLWNTRKFATKATNENKDTIEDEVQFIIYYFLLMLIPQEYEYEYEYEYEEDDGPKKAYVNPETKEIGGQKGPEPTR